jgi:predicted RNase H-like nuclease (RuvC/YqgF family)
MGDIDPYPDVQVASCNCEHCRARREETLKHKVTSLEAENRSLSADVQRRIEEMAGLRNEVKRMREANMGLLGEQIKYLGEIRDMRSHISDALSYMQQGQEALKEANK